MQRKQFIWRIQDSKSTQPNCYYSDNFEVTKNDISSIWSLALHPTYASKAQDRPFSIYLKLLQLNKLVIKIRYKLAVINTTKPPPNNEQTFTKEQVWMVNDTSLNSIKGFNIREVESRLINYVINCNITILEAGTFSNEADFISRELSSLMINEEFSDVVLESRGEQQLRAHKCVLAARSPVFAAMFKLGWKEGRDATVKIDDLDGATLRRLLDYVYAGKFEDNENDDLEVIGGLLAAADKYAIEDLKENYAEALYKRLSVDNVLDIIALANDHGALGLKEEAMDFIAEHPEVIDSSKFLEAEKTNPLLINQILRRTWRRYV